MQNQQQQQPKPAPAKPTAITRKLNDEQLARFTDTATQLETIANDFGLAKLSSVANPMMRALKISEGVQRLREILTVEQVEFLFMPLMGTKLGFVTDRDNKPQNERYTAAEVRDVLVEALLRGFLPTGNEFNIIANNFYGAKNGLERQVREWPGFSELKLELGEIVMSGGGALVPAKISGFLDGTEVIVDCWNEGHRIPVKVNQGMGPDAIHGKAERKLYHRMLKRLAGNAGGLVGPEADPDVINTTATPAIAPPEKDGTRMKLGPKTEATEAPAGQQSLREPGQEG